MTDTTTADVTASVPTPEMLSASGQAAIKAVLFCQQLFEGLWENDIDSVTEEQLRAVAVECGVVVERELTDEDIARIRAVDPNFAAEAGDVLPELSDELMTFIATIEAAEAEDVQ